MVTYCVVHYDICPGVCLNLIDGSLLKIHINAPITSARLVAAHVVEETSTNVVSVSAPLIVSTPCHAALTVLDVYNSIRDTANLPPIIDGRHSLMLQERWEGNVLAGILAFFFCHLDSPIDAPAWSPFPFIP